MGLLIGHMLCDSRTRAGGRPTVAEILLIAADLLFLLLDDAGRRADRRQHDTAACAAGAVLMELAADGSIRFTEKAEPVKPGRLVCQIVPDADRRAVRRRRREVAQGE